jgi:hypothetical protein
LTREFSKRWLRFAFVTVMAVGLWTLAAVHDYAWQMIWLPAAAAGAAWPAQGTGTRDRCLRRLRLDRDTRA